jgi:AcrR family transcriptional regulator
MLRPVPPSQVSTITEVKRRATVDRVLASARLLVMARGLDVTMDEIADDAGVSRRTLFRIFETRERLVAGALEAGVQMYGELLPSYDDDWRTWLRELCRAAHHMQAGYGPGYWELTSRSDLPAEIAAVEKRRRVRRREAMARIARKLWLEAGGEGHPPAVFVAGVSAHLSPRFTAAVTSDVGQSWKMAADLADTAITGLLGTMIHGS